MWFILRYLCLATVVLCIEQPRGENVEHVRQSLHFRRAIDDKRDGNHFNIEDDGSYDRYESASDYYDSSQVKSGFADIRSNVPGEPGVDYPVYESVPKTSFTCLGRVQGYYADEEAGCQAFHVCNNVMVSSFICPLGSIFSQQLLTCDWWNRVDCAMTGAYYSSHRRIYADDNEMVQKAFTMMQLPVHHDHQQNSMRSDPQPGVRHTNTANIEFKRNNGQEVSGRETRYYNNDPIRQFRIYENLESRRNEPVVNKNTQPKKNVINFELRPTNFETSHPRHNLRLNNNAKDSSITYIKENVNYNAQDSSSTLRPFTLGNSLQNSYQSNDKIVRSKYQSSYAPTVPTVTTTTKRFYSPTVPTTYRPSTTSHNTYDQYFQSSAHFYTHSRNLVTPRSMIDYDDMAVDDDLLELPINQESSQVAKNTAAKGHYDYDSGEVVLSEESIGIAQGFGEKLNKVGNPEVKEAKDRTGRILQSAKPTGQGKYFGGSESNIENTRTQLGSKPLNITANGSDNQRNYQHFYSNLLSLAMKQDEQVTEKVDGPLANNYTQMHDIPNTRNKENQNFISSRLSVAPLIVQIPRPPGPSGRPVTDLADQLFSYESFIRMASSTPQTTQPEAAPSIDFASFANRVNTFESATRLPPLIPQISTQFTGSAGTANAADQTQPFGSVTRIPPLISQFSPPAESSGTGTPRPMGDDGRTPDSPIRIPPLIPQISTQFTGSAGAADIADQLYTSGSPTGIPPLIPQPSRSVVSSGAESPSPIGDDNKTFDSPTGIPPLIPQPSQSAASPGAGSLSPIGDDDKTFDSPTGIPPLIPQLSQSAASPGAGNRSPIGDDDRTFDSPTGIPPLIPQISTQFTGSAGAADIADQLYTFGSPTGIPPLIPQPSQSAASPGAGSLSPIGDDDKTFDSPTGIPPLIPQPSQSAVSSGAGSLSPIGDGDKTFDSPTGIPPLIPQISTQFTGSAGATDIADQLYTSGSPTGIPPLIPQPSQSTVSSGAEGPGPIGDDDKTFDSPTGIRPLIPQPSQSAASPGAGSLSPIGDDDKTFDSPTGIPPLIPQISTQFTGSAGATDIADQLYTFGSATGILPLIPQPSQSAVSSGAGSLSPIGDGDKTFDSPTGIPPLIPQISTQFTGSAGATDIADQLYTSGSPTGIPPLIPQPSQSAVSSGAEGPGPIGDDDNTFDSPTRIRPLIPQIPTQFTGSAGATDIADQLYTSELPTGIPPLIPQPSQSAVSSGAEGPGPIGDDDKTFDSPTGIPPLIPQVSTQFTGSAGATDIADQLYTSGSPTGIPPLIPQPSQSAVSSGAEGPGPIGDDDNTFDSPTRIRPLIPQIPTQFTGSAGATDIADQLYTSELPTGIPPLIPQPSQSAVSSGAEGPGPIGDDDKTFDSPTGIPPLIPQVSTQFTGSAGATDIADQLYTFGSATGIPPFIPQPSQSTVSSGAEGPGPIGDDDKTFDSPTRIRPLIPQIPTQFTGSAGATDIADQLYTFGSATGIPPLIPQPSQSTVSSGAEGPGPIGDDDKTFDSPTRIRPLIPQIPTQFTGSAGATDIADQLYTSGSPTGIPPLIPQPSQSAASTGAGSPSPIGDDDKTFDSPTGIPPLIPQPSQSVASPGAGSLSPIGDDDKTFDSPTGIPPLIPQPSQSAASPGAESPSPIGDDDKTFDSPTRIRPLIPQIPTQFTGSAGATDIADQLYTSGSPTGRPPLIPQPSQSAVSSGAEGPGPIGDDDKTFDSPTGIPPLIPQVSTQFTGSAGATDIADQFYTFGSPTGIPPLIPQPSQSAASTGAGSPSPIGDDDKTFDSPTGIPPLIPQPSQSVASPGAGSLSPIGDDDKTFDSPTGIPPLIPQISTQFTGSAGAADIADQLYTFGSPTGIPPLIPQPSQSAVSSGAGSPSPIGDDNKTFDSPTRIPPLIPQISQSAGASVLDLMNVDNPDHMFGSSTAIPPLILQFSQSAESSRPDFTNVIDDNMTFDLPSRIPALIPQFSQSVGSSGSDPIDLGNRDENSESSTAILPLIPQISQSAASPEVRFPGLINDDNKTFDVPTKIPPLIPQVSPQPIGASGVGAVDVVDQTQTSEPATRIPPLIFQISQSAVPPKTQSSSTINEDNKTFDLPPRIPLLIPQITLFTESPGVGSATVADRTQTFESSVTQPQMIPNIVSSAESPSPDSPTTIVDHKTFDLPSQTLTPPLIYDIPHYVGSPAVDNDQTHAFESSTRTPLLIPLSPQFEVSSGPQYPNAIDDHQVLDSFHRIPPLISQIPQTVGSSGVDSTAEVDDRTQIFESSSLPPPPISNFPRPTESAGSGDDTKTFVSTPRIPPLILQTPHSKGPPVVASMEVDHGIQTLELSTGITPSITQTSQTKGSSEAQSPNVIGIGGSFYLPPQTRIVTHTPEVLYSVGSTKTDSAIVDDRTHTFKLSNKTPGVISQTLKSIGSSMTQSTHSAGEEHISDGPPRILSVISQFARPLALPGMDSANSFHQKHTSSDKTPVLNPQLTPSEDLSVTQSTFGGQYPLRHFATPTQLPGRQLVTRPSSERTPYDSSIKYVSRLATRTTTISPSGNKEDSKDSAFKEFRINFPDFPPYNVGAYYTQSNISSATKNLHPSGASPSKTLIDQASSMDVIDEPSTATSSHMEESPVQDSKVNSNLPTANVQQVSATDVRNTTSSSLPTRNQGGSLISNGHSRTESTNAEVEAPALTLSLPNVDNNNYKLFKHAPGMVSPISDNPKPISQDFGPTGNRAKYNDDLQFTVKGALQHSGRFPAINAIPTTHVPPQSVVTPSSAPGHRVSDLENQSINDGSRYLSQSGNPFHNVYQESNSPKLFDEVISGGSIFVPTSSQSPLGYFGYVKDSFETSTPANVVDTTGIEFATNRNVSHNKFSQGIGSSGLPPDLPFGFTHIQSSLNNDDSPYEVSFTVNGDEDFDPSGDFITKLLAQHEGNLSLGLEGFEGYEIIKSEDPAGPNVDDVKSAPLPNTEPSAVHTGRLAFDPRGSFENRPSESESGSPNQNSNSSTPISKTIEIQPARIKLPKSDDLPRPFFFGTGQDAVLQTRPNSKSTDFSILQWPFGKSNEELQGSVDLSKLQPEAKDINGSLESLFEFVPPPTESPPLLRAQILEELTKHFGQPLYNGGFQRDNVTPQPPRSVDYNAGQQFANLQQYRVGKNDVPKQELAQTNPTPPKPIPTTTPAPVRTFVETEIIPSLGFSFDFDEGRNEYVEAVLKGLLSDNQPVNPWRDDRNFYRESRGSSAPRNHTSKH